MSKNINFTVNEYLAIYSAVAIMCKDIQSGFDCPKCVKDSYFSSMYKLQGFLNSKGLVIDVIR